MAQETREQMDTPEGRAARDAARRSRERVAETATTARQSASQEWNEAKAATRERVDATRQRVGERVGATRQRVGETTHRVQEGVQSTTHRVQEGVEDATHRVQEGVQRVQHEAQELKETTERRIQEVRHDVQEFKQDVGRKAGAVQESARRAKTAPGKIWHEMAPALKEATADYGLWFAALAVAGLIALDALVVLTIWLVAAMSALVGFVIGTFLAGLILVLVAVGIYYFGRSKRHDGQDALQDGVQHSREVVQNVQEPVRREFGGGTRGAS